ncbi:DNA polymerase III subunit alpha [Phycicoccus sp. BSK3Z-2]|uniref:DNA polymerase III subunit alpha n=1 Tax=Phycicoccus avicenniae TaxID=2828860 RepID=A0A941D9W3_9MICO|nr:DNA polymerase III subunit alpha [Phycicoccus avicenniae]MBR7744430.1 DNA polymerase III subunit alpha [Phycicoccus avicenniae]
MSTPSAPSPSPTPRAKGGDQFVHLHVHTEYSMLDGAARIGDLFERAAEMGMPALATTDHGYVFGAYEFWKKAQGTGVKPIIGVEAYVTPGTHRSDKTRVKWGDERTRPGDDVSGSGAYTHMTLLAKDNDGLRNLFRLDSQASLDQVYAKWPRIDRELLDRYGSGLVATTGCPSGEIQTRIRLGQYDAAKQAASDFRDIFGKENYFCELMDHGLDIERRVQQDLLRIARELDLPLVATNDLHYTSPEDAKAHGALLCVQSGSTMMDPNRFKFDADSFYLKSAEEMRHTWRELPEACDNTLLIADMCDISFTEGEGRYMPRFPCPPGENEESWFVKEVESGLRERFPEGVPDYARRQAEYETDVITTKGYCFTPETPVLMGDGSWRPIEEVQVGDAVTSVDTRTFRGRGATVERVLTREVREDLHVIRPHGQVFPIKATAEHPFLVAHRGWVEAGDVRPGDELLLPQPEIAPYQDLDLGSLMADNGWTVRRSDDGRLTRLGAGRRRAPRPNVGSMPEKVEWSEDLMWLLGLWVAEGHLYDPDGDVNPGQVGWTLHRDEPAVTRLQEVTERLGLGSPRVYSKASACAPEHAGVTVMLTNHPLALLLRELFGTGVRGKSVPEWVLSVPDAGLRAFVAGWHEGDGHVDVRGKWMVTTVNDVLARQLRTILLRLGQWATVTGSPSQRSYKVLWVPGGRKQPYNARYIDGRWWVRVRAVDREEYEGTVYNLTVTGDHTYVAEGVAVHNCGYFLVVADFITWAKDNGIRVGPGRGSGAGSMCAYAMKITDLDPVPHGLIFERFLNPERQSMPDFDVDFDERRRGEVIKYVTEKYGDERVAQIVTYGTIKAKQAVKDSSRVMGHPFSVGEQLTKAMPADVMGKGVPLSGIYDPEHARYGEGKEFRDLVATEPYLQEIVETAKGLEGLKRQWGVHAAGVIMSSEPLIDVIPIMRRLQDGQVITQFDYPSCENLGLVKMDFLGLRNLTILDDAIENVKANRGEDIDLDALTKTLDDEPTYELLQRGDTLGVFQLDGGGMRTLLKLMQPDNFEDISAALALYRPGPMGVNAHTNFALRKNGKQALIPLDPQLEGKLQPEMVQALEPILGTTYGLVIYQEQVMEIAQKLAGYTLGNADLLRRAMGKKKKEVLDKEYEPFSAGMKAQGFNEASVAALWGVLVPFSDYAFNKAHTAAYGLVSYWTAYLKANYPAEYMAALLTSVGDDKDKSALYLGECRRMGIKVLPPDVNDSVGQFAAVGTDIRFGLNAIRNVGQNVVEEIKKARTTKGRFESFEDFVSKVPLVPHGSSEEERKRSTSLNKRAIDSLVKGGAFDGLSEPRLGLTRVYEQYVDEYANLQKQQVIGQDSLFDALMGGAEDEMQKAVMGLPPVPQVEWDKSVKLKEERDMLGLYVSDHPLFGVEHVLQSAADTQIATLTADEGGRPEGATVTIAGLITSLAIKRTKKGDLWAIATVEDLAGSIECLFFPSAYMTVAGMLQQDQIAVVRGRVNRRDDTVSIYAQDLTLPDVTEGPRGPVVVTMETARATNERIEELKGVLTNHPGSIDVHLRLTKPGRSVEIKLDHAFRVAATEALYGDLKVLLGPRCLS